LDERPAPSLAPYTHGRPGTPCPTVSAPPAPVASAPAPRPTPPAASAHAGDAPSPLYRQSAAGPARPPAARPGRPGASRLRVRSGRRAGTRSPAPERHSPPPSVRQYAGAGAAAARSPAVRTAPAGTAHAETGSAPHWSHPATTPARYLREGAGVPLLLHRPP